MFSLPLHHDTNTKALNSDENLIPKCTHCQSTKQNVKLLLQQTNTPYKIQTQPIAILSLWVFLIEGLAALNIENDLRPSDV